MIGCVVMNKKAFTLVEILAVVVLLGVILAFATPKVISIINESTIKAYVAMEKNIQKAASDYVLVDELVLPTTSGQHKVIDLNKLVSEKMINTVYDAKDTDSECLGYVVVTKKDEYGYNYNTCLFCSGY